MRLSYRRQSTSPTTALTIINFNYLNMKIVIYISLLGLLGCATPYQSGFKSSGGYEEIVVNEKLHKITFEGNRFNKEGEVQKYAFFRCAEYANSLQKPYFIIYQNLIDAATHRFAVEPQLGLFSYSPFATVYVMALDDTQLGAFNTADVLDEMHQYLEE